MSTTDEIMKLADEYAKASFDQGLHRVIATPNPEQHRAALLKAVEQLTADAARYRFARENGIVRVQVDTDLMNAWPEYSHDALDAAIDAARKETP